jgi:hypothetical protein
MARVALLGTLRKDGSPRISPVGPYLCQEHLLFGAMSWSIKTRDLQHDPRCVLRSAITVPDAGELEFKLYGRAMEAPSEIPGGSQAGGKHNRGAPLSSSRWPSSRRRSSNGTCNTAR